MASGYATPATHPAVTGGTASAEQMNDLESAVSGAFSNLDSDITNATTGVVTKANEAAASAQAAAASAASSAQDALDTAADVVLTDADQQSCAADASEVATNLLTFQEAYLGALASDPAPDPGSATTPEIPLTGQLYWNTSNNVMYSYNGATWGAATSTPTSMTAEQFVGGTTAQGGDGGVNGLTYTLTATITDEDNAFVYIDGIYQNKANFSLVGQVLTLTTAPHYPAEIEVVIAQEIGIGVPGDDTVGADQCVDYFNLVPSGVMMVWHSTIASIPTGWKICDGSTWTINGVSTAVPDMTDRMIIHADVENGSGNGTTSFGVKETIDGTGDTGSHTLLTTEIPAHSHEIMPLNAGAVVGAGEYIHGAQNASSYGTVSTGDTGGGGGHVHPTVATTKPKSIALAWIIKIDQ